MGQATFRSPDDRFHLGFGAFVYSHTKAPGQCSVQSLGPTPVSMMTSLIGMQFRGGLCEVTWVIHNSLKCLSGGYSSTVTGECRKGNLGRHRRLKLNIQGVQYYREGTYSSWDESPYTWPIFTHICIVSCDGLIWILSMTVEEGMYPHCAPPEPSRTSTPMGASNGE